MVVAPGRMIDSFLSIPDAESLPLYRMVLKLACVCVYTHERTLVCRRLPAFACGQHARARVLACTGAAAFAYAASACGHVQAKSY